jgi:phage gpG-like protein
MLFEFSEITLPAIPNKLEGDRFEKFKADISAKMFSQRLDVFEAQASRDGAWKPLSQIQSEKREQKLDKISNARLEDLSRKGFTRVKILQDTGILRQSFTPETGPGNAFKHVEIAEDYVRNSTNVEYARIQNQGGTILPKKGKFLVFLAADGRKIFAKKVTIPARPYDQFTDEQEAELVELTEGYLNGKL